MRHLYLLLLLLALPFFAQAQVLINEVQSSNGITAEDEDGDNEDWIELYNAGAEAVNLDGYWLSDNDGNPQRWRLPAVTIGAGETLLIWASNKNRATAGSPLHTNFAISAGGEEILLSAPNGELLDRADPMAIATDVSWGRSPDGADNWVFFAEPTPGASNSTQGYSEVLTAPVFSAAGGFYSNDFDLTISHSDPAVTIIYTLDGSIPNPDNIDGVSYSYKNRYRQSSNDSSGELLENSFYSHSYTGAISIVDRSPEPDKLAAIATSFDSNPYYFPETPVTKGTVVRARAYKPGAIASPITTHTYFVNDTGQSPHELTVISLGIQEDGLFDYENGIHVAGSRFDQWRDANPSANADGSSHANWQMRGVEWERPAHIELFEPGATEAGLKQDIGVRIHGGWSRAHRQKSLRLYSRNAYGESRFNYPMFPDQDSSGYNRLILRNSGNDNDYTLFRDAMIQALGAELRIDTQAYRPTVVYINGEHWGILNLRERYDRHYLARTYNVNPDNVDILTNNNEVDEGDAEHYLATVDYIANNSMAVDSHFAHVQTRVDTDNYMDYTIANIYSNNRDWPGNNIDYWRLRTSEYLPSAPYGHDGRWRWMWYDSDFGFGLYDSGYNAATLDTMTFATQAGLTEWPNPDWSTFLLRNLLENEGFKRDFINRFADLLNTHFHPERVTGVIEQMKAEIAADIPGHHTRWKHPWVHPTGLDNWWQQQVQIMTDFANARPGYQRQHLRDFFGLGSDYQLTLNTSDTSRGHIRVNTVDIRPETPGVTGYPWSGTYFGGVPIELEAIAAPGFAFSHWSGLPDNTGAKAELTPNDDLEVTAHFVASAPPYLHAFVFGNDLANNTPLEAIEATLSYTENSGRIVFHSALGGYPFDSDSPNWRRASMERRNAPTPINYPLDTPYADFTMRALQIKQPFMGDAGENTLILELPTTGHSAAMLRFAAMDEGAADSLLIDYATNSGTPQWTTAGLSQTILPLADEFQGYTLNFAGIAAVDNNPHFKVRIRFAGPNMMADNGDRVTFNNITLDLHQSEELAYFWLFDNDLANNTELTHIAPRFAALPGAYIGYHSSLPGYPDTDRKASMERRNEPTEVNYFAAGNYGVAYADVTMRAVQIKQPFQGPAGENAMILHLPTSGMNDPLLRFAAMDEGAAQFLRIDYATNAGQPQWTRAGLTTHNLPLIEDSYQLYTVDFSGINGARNNPHFKVRIRFGGDDMTVDNGDRVTFNNISLHSRLAGAEAVPETPIDPDNPNAPANNRFAYAQTLTGASGSSLGSNVHASTETGEPDHASAISGASAGNSVWWQWTAADTERMVFSSSLSGIDSLVAVYTGTQLQNLNPVAAINLAADQLWFVAEAGETYHIAVAGNVAGNNSAEGDIALTWHGAAPAAAPIIIDSLPGEPGIVCEVPECALDEQGNLEVIMGNRHLSVILPDPNTHQHSLKATEGEQTLWHTLFSGQLPGTLSRVMADVDGLPFVATRFDDASGKHYQIDAYADGRARQRIVATDGQLLLSVHSLIAGAVIEVNEQSEGQLTLSFPELAQAGMRLLLEVDNDTYLKARYQRYNSDSESWVNNSDLLTDTRFAPGAKVLLERIDGEIRIRIDSHISDDLYF